MEKNLYDQRDVDNVKNNDLYVSQFIRKNETIAEAADRLHEALKWRKETTIRGTCILLQVYMPKTISSYHSWP